MTNKVNESLKEGEKALKTAIAAFNRATTQISVKGLLEREDVEEKISSNIEYVERRWLCTLSLMILWTGIIGSGFYFISTEFLCSTEGKNLLYSAQSHSVVANAFVATTALFGASGGLTRSIYDSWFFIWKARSLKDIKNPVAGVTDAGTGSGKITGFLNSSPRNQMFMRPVLTPIMGALVGLITAFIIYGLRTDLPRLAVVSFASGLVAQNSTRWIRDKASNLLKT